MNQPVSNQQGTVNPDDSFQKIRLARLLQIQEELDLRKALYAEYDQIVLELAHSGFVSAIIDDLVLELEDNFKDTNTGWTSAAVKRFELRVETKEKREKRLAWKAKKEASGE